MSDCQSCVNFVAHDDVATQRRIYGSKTGVSSCVATGALLGTPAMGLMDMETLQGVRRNECGMYRIPADNSADGRSAIKVGVSLPLTLPDEAEGNTRAVSSCKACHFFIDEGRVREGMRVNVGMCGKYAKLVPQGKISQVARDCPSNSSTYLVPGTSLQEHEDELLLAVVIDPTLGERLSVQGPLAILPGSGSAQQQASSLPQHQFIEPIEYPSDLPVSQEMLEKQGIRAWRKIPSPDGSKHTYLPIFDAGFFGEHERNLIPATGCDEHPEEYQDHLHMTYKTSVLWRELDMTPALHGLPGSGKTEYFRYLAWLMQLPFHRISITKRSELDDLAGKTNYSPERGTYFEYGRIPIAWRTPCVVLLDEPNTGPAEVWQFIRPLTDDSKQLVLDSNAGEVIPRDDNCYLGMAMNPAWDMRNSSVEPLAAADGSRLMHIAVNLPDEQTERSIILRRCAIDNYEPHQKFMDSLMRIAKVLRDLGDELPITWGIREQIQVATASKWFSMEESYCLAACDLLDPSEKERILDIVRVNKTGGNWS